MSTMKLKTENENFRFWRDASTLVTCSPSKRLLLDWWVNRSLLVGSNRFEKLDSDFGSDSGANSPTIANGNGRKFPRHIIKSSSSWTSTEVRSYVHVHDWTVRGFSVCEFRFLETSVNVKENVNPNVLLEQHQSMMFRIRLHPQGNKESNKNFCFFQIFAMTNNPKFKAKFHVFNSKDEEVPTTIYAGTQQLNGYFEYVQRDILLAHINSDDELRVQVQITTFTETVITTGNSADRIAPEIKPDNVAQDLEKAYNDERFADFKIFCGEGPDQRVLNVHKVVLAARSPYFAALFAPHTKESKENKLELPDVDYEVFSILIFFLYGRSPSIRSASIALDILALSDRFQMTSLKDLASRFLRTKMRCENVCKALVTADQHFASDLKDEAIIFLIKNLKSIIKNAEPGPKRTRYS
ncbi:hypothetical protein M3Y94_01138500 [Aphelenchoides besseyi]|nr:hypothetical protein M3Y94_01138500 [Aphelenchoides besseyi]